MKRPPAISTPLLFRSDLTEARKVLGCEPGLPVGVVTSREGFAELRAYGCAFPCPVAIDITAHRETCEWYFLPANFQRFAPLVVA